MLSMIDSIEGQVTVGDLAECNWIVLGDAIIRYHNDYRQIWRGDIQDVPNEFRSEIVDLLYIDGTPEIYILKDE